MSTLPENHAERLERSMLSLQGLAIGDAFGEMLAYDSASAPARVEDGLVGGPWFHTDDTEMALEIFLTLQREGRIQPTALARAFAERFQRDPDRGYGKMARMILRQILAGDRWELASAQAFSGQGSMGNSGAMRVAPLGAYFADEPDDRICHEANLSAVVTHMHPEGRAGAVAVAIAAARAWQLRGVEKRIAASRLMQAVYDLTPPGETRTGIARAIEVPFSESSKRAARILGNGSEVTAPDTVPFVIWSAAKHLDDYKAALVNTVVADGDCDTNCAMVGGIVALYAGLESIPEDWRAARERFEFE